MTKWWIAGSRDIDAENIQNGVKMVLFKHLKMGDEIKTGGARGIDRLVERLLRNRLFSKLELTIHPSLKANWRIGKGAGIIRNTRGITWSDRVIVFWDGKSRGSKHVIEYAKKHDKEVEVILINDNR